MKRLSVVHDSKNQGSSVLIWRGLLQIWNQRFLHQLLSYIELSQCCPWPPKPWMICTDLKVCFETGTNVFCNNHFLIVKRLRVVHSSQHLGTSVLIWRSLLQIWNQRFLQQPLSCGDTSQCCPCQPKPGIIGTDLKRSAANLIPTVSATTIFLQRSVSMLCHFHIVKRLNNVYDNQSLE